MPRTWWQRHIGGLIPWVTFHVQYGRNPLLWWAASIRVVWIRCHVEVEIGR